MQGRETHPAALHLKLPGLHCWRRNQLCPLLQHPPARLPVLPAFAGSQPALQPLTGALFTQALPEQANHAGCACTPQRALVSGGVLHPDKNRLLFYIRNPHGCSSPPSHRQNKSLCNPPPPHTQVLHTTGTKPGRSKLHLTTSTCSHGALAPKSFGTLAANAQQPWWAADCSGF